MHTRLGGTAESRALPVRGDLVSGRAGSRSTPQNSKASDRACPDQAEGNARPTPGISCAGSGTSVTCWLLL